MRALLSGERLGIDGLSIEELACPEPGPGEVRIRVDAVGINYPDTLVVADRYQFKPPRPFAPGGELAGVVDKLGADVAGLAVGDRVLAMNLWGALAEYTVSPRNRVHPIPDALPSDQAASLMTTYGTVMHALVDRASLRAGETVLVLGAAGGVGLATVEVARALGARVVAAVSSEEKAQLAREAGAEPTAQAATREAIEELEAGKGARFASVGAYGGFTG